MDDRDRQREADIMRLQVLSLAHNPRSILSFDPCDLETLDDQRAYLEKELRSLKSGLSSAVSAMSPVFDKPAAVIQDAKRQIDIILGAMSDWPWLTSTADGIRASPPHEIRSAVDALAGLLRSELPNAIETLKAVRSKPQMPRWKNEGDVPPEYRVGGVKNGKVLTADTIKIEWGISKADLSPNVTRNAGRIYGGRKGKLVKAFVYHFRDLIEWNDARDSLTD